MTKRYEHSDEAWTMVDDLFIATHGRGRSRRSDQLMLDGVHWVLCSVLRGEICRSDLAVVNGVSMVSGQAKPRVIRSDAQALAPEVE